MSDRGPSDGVNTSVTCLYLAAAAAAARARCCSCFPKCAGQSMIMRKDILIRDCRNLRTACGLAQQGARRRQEGLWSPSHLRLGVGESLTACFTRIQPSRQHHKLCVFFGFFLQTIMVFTIFGMQMFRQMCLNVPHFQQQVRGNIGGGLI